MTNFILTVVISAVIASFLGILGIKIFAWIKTWILVKRTFHDFKKEMDKNDQRRKDQKNDRR